MKVFRIALLLSFSLMAFSMTLSNLNAEIPAQPKESLHASASHALVGTVMQTYERVKTTERYKYRYGVAEVAVERVDKGGEIVAGDRVFVRYWRKLWTGDGFPPPQHFGHGNIPAKDDIVELYVKGDRKSGFDVLSPNGFFKVTSPKPSEPDPSK